MKDVLKNIYRFLTNRILILLTMFSVMFYLLCAALFDMQIVNGTPYVPAQGKTRTSSVNINAPRGTIYDRKGRPLALNETTYVVKIDPTEKADDQNSVMYNFTKLMEKNNETIVNDFKISETIPRRYLHASDDQTRFWLKNMDILRENISKEVVYKYYLKESDSDLDLDIIEYNDDVLKEVYERFIADESPIPAELAYDHLLEFFAIPQKWTEHEKYMAVSLRSSVYMQRYAMGHITAAMNVKEETVVALEEYNQELSGIYVDIDYLRIYPEGLYMSNILGYIGKINDEEYERNKDLGYTNTDLIGKIGIEQALELSLRGIKGSRSVEIASNGKQTGLTEEIAPIPGNKVYLTIDAELQRKTYHIIEDKLTEILINKLTGQSDKEDPITVKEFLISMLTSNNISVLKIMESKEDSLSFTVRARIEANAVFKENDKNSAEYKKELLDYIVEQIESGRIKLNEIIAVMVDQKVVTVDKEQLASLQRGTLPSLNFLISKLESGEITPQMTNLMPCTGSVVLQNVNTGEVLVAVGYPSYDNNELVNVINAEYYAKLNNDPTTPMFNRPFYEKRAPGSTFKMISAIAALETGVVTPATKIYDESYFTKPGEPYPRCWSLHSHGSLTVAEALEVSCNYYFCETSYRMGNTKEGTKIEGINALNKYMEYFGLNDPTGVEINEASSVIASPVLMEGLEKRQWVDGDTNRVAFGQSINNYSSASMVKYISMLATGGVRYQSHLLDRIESANSELLTEFTPVEELKIDIKPENIAAVYAGMLQVTGFERGTNRGTARTIFADFPIAVAGKTGTAEQLGGPAHSSFGGFAPFDNPEIAVYVMIPRADTLTGTSSPASYVARDVISAYFGLDRESQYVPNENALQQ